MKKQIVKNISSTYLGNSLSMVLGFLVVPFLIQKLNKELFGISVLAESIIAFSQIFVFSIRISLSRAVTVALSQNNLKSLEEYLSVGRGILYVLALFFIVPCALMSYFFPLIFNIPVEFANQSRILFLLISVGFCISIPNVVYWSIVYAHHRFDLINISNFGGNLVRILLIFLLFSILPKSYINLVTYGIIYLLMTWAQNFLIYNWHRRLMPGLKVVLKWDLSKLKEIVSYAGYASVGNLSTVLYENAMNIVINIFWGPASNALYSVGMKIPNMMKRLFLEPTWSLIPTLTDLVARDEKHKIEQVFFFYSKVVNLVILPIAIVLMIYSQDILIVWVGKDFISVAQAMSLFIAVTIMSIPAAVCSAVNNAFGKIKIPTQFNLILAVLNIGFGVFLGKNLSWGLAGIGWAAVIVTFLGSVLFLPVYSCRIGQFSVKTYFQKSILEPLVLSLLLILVPLLGLKQFNGHVSFSTVLACLGLIAVNYFCSFQFLFLEHEKKFSRELLGGVLNKLGLNWK